MLLFAALGLIALAACGSAASAVEPGASSGRQIGSPAPAADPIIAQDQPSPVEPAHQTGPAPAATLPVQRAWDDPEDLIHSALDLALEGDSLAVHQIGLSGDTAYIPVLVDLLRFSWSFPAEDLQGAVLTTLDDIAGRNYPDFVTEEPTSWAWWINWLGQNPEIEPPSGYPAWKGRLYAELVDPEMGAFLYSGVKTNIRVEEIVWGGVPKDGIPDLTNPPIIDAGKAGYLNAEDRVFGVSFNGEHRAYPHRILNAHEMANDVVGGVPFALAY